MKNYFDISLKLVKQDIEKIKPIIIVLGVYLLVRRFLHNMCPFVLLTGYPCPLCGMTRAFFALFRGDLSTAWQLHAFSVLLVIALILLGIRRYIFHKKIKRKKLLLLILCSGLLVYYIYRIVFCFDGIPPMSYYRDNLLHRVAEAVMHLISQVP